MKQAYKYCMLNERRKFVPKIFAHYTHIMISVLALLGYFKLNHPSVVSIC